MPAARSRNISEADQAAARRLKELWLAIPKEERPTQQAIAERWGGDANQSLISQYFNGRIALNYRAVLTFASILGCDPFAIRSDLPEQKLSTGLPTAAAQPLRLDPEKIADTTEVLQVILGRRGGRTLDLTQLSHAAMFAEAYALREKLDDAPEAEFTASVIDLVAAMEERDRGERAREQAGSDAGGRVRRSGAA